LFINKISEISLKLYRVSFNDR